MNKLILGMMMVAVLVVCSAPAMAIDCWQNVETNPYGTSGIVEGTVYVGGGDEGGPSETFDVPSGNIIWAKVFWHAWMPPNDVDVTFSNAGGSTDNTVNRCVNSASEGFLHGGCGTGWMWWDVTAIVTNGPNTIDVDADSYWQVLVVVLEIDGYPQTHYWVNNGYLDTGYTTHFNGPATNTRSGTAWQLAACWNDNARIYFNTHLLEESSGPGGYGALVKYGIDSSWMNTADNTLTWDPDDEYFHPVLAIFKDSLDPEPDLEVTEIDTNPETPRPGQDFVIDATVENGGVAAGPFDVSLYIDGTFNTETRVGAGLPAGGSTTISFSPINLPEDCHNFTVIADCNGEVDEADEGNNGRTEYYQVGYVIVVESDSDFAALAADPGMPAGSVTYDSGTDTYYIQDLTITNCAGDGIFIEGTTKNFVIKDCTIENCASDGSGVFLNDVTKGTITECTLQNNEAYGVELGLVPLDSEDPKFINITCNTIYQNGMSTSKNGIDLIGTDCNVAYNHVIDNGQYGIYVYGNGNKIHNNTIEDNDNYGIKLYSSSGNYIYRNDLSNNNGGGVQGYDDMTANIWRTPTQVNYCYSGTTYYGYTGNYWDDHEDPTDPDGIMDTPYPLDGGAGAMDSYSAAVPWWRCGDVNRDGPVNAQDSLGAFRGLICSSRWAANANGCVDCQVNAQDSLRMFQGTQDCCPTCCWCYSCDR